MVTLSEIESAVEALPPDQQEAFVLFLSSRFSKDATGIRQTDTLIEQPSISQTGTWSTKEQSEEASGDHVSRLESEFQRLTCEWQTATKYQSSVTAICSHPSYQRIIGMGQVALPFILQELQQSPHLWFWALKAITGDDPVPPEHRGRVALMAADWIAWARQRGLCES